MILESLIRELTARLDYDKRALCCLWFDAPREYLRLLPALREELEQKRPAPFRLLEYALDSGHGQLWLKHQIHASAHAAHDAGQPLPRFVVYLPVPEERIHLQSDDGAALDMLVELELLGQIWKVDGKKSTLFAYLRRIGVPLPEEPAEQRRLWEGGAESLLARYALKYCREPREFWLVPLTPEWVHARLLGDMDQILLDLAVDPEQTLAEIREKGQVGDLYQALRERYGFEADLSNPRAWMKSFAERLALTETYLGYGSPHAFPFVDRLPTLARREVHVQFLQRWLRDRQARPAWSRWMREIERDVDLTLWAQGRSGLSYGLPHLVQARWERTLATLDEVSPRASEIEAFFKRERTHLESEVEYAAQSHADTQAWAELVELGKLLEHCRAARPRIEKASGLGELAKLYVEVADSIDGRHLRLRRAASERELPVVARIADRIHAEWAQALEESFLRLLLDQGHLAVPGLPSAGEGLEQAFWGAKGRRALVIVDALRYDCALELKQCLSEIHAEVEPWLGALPSITPMGMTVLLPLAGAQVSLVVQGGALRPMVNGIDMSMRENRIRFLRDRGVDCREIDAVEGASKVPKVLGECLVVFGHEEVDQLGHAGAGALTRHVSLEIERIARLVKRLHSWGYAEVHVVTDHGFVLADEDRLPPTVDLARDRFLLVKERYAVAEAGVDLSCASLPAPWGAPLRIAVPPGLAFFKAEKSFSHGGATLRELVLPHLVSRAGVKEARRSGVEVIVGTNRLASPLVRFQLRGVPVGVGSQADLFAEPHLGRSLALDVLRVSDSKDGKSILEPNQRTLIELGGAAGSELQSTLFFRSSLTFEEGEHLRLEVRDTETGERFPPDGILLVVTRRM